MPVIPGSRVRSNNAYGVTTDNPLTAIATTFNSTQLILLPAIIVGQHTVVVLDPKRVFGQPEIVIVTAHTGLSTTATITRAAYGTTARSHPVGTVWAHVAVDEDYIEIGLSSNRPVDPYIGQVTYETDTQSVRHFNGTIWNSSPPVGVILPYGGSTAPTGYILADGVPQPRTGITADLFAAWNVNYGSGDGLTTFGIPNLRGKAPFGIDPTDPNMDAFTDTFGVKTVTLGTTQIPSHQHTVTDNGHTHTQNAHGHGDGSHGHPGSDDDQEPNHNHAGAGGFVYAVSIGGPQNARLSASPGDDAFAHGPYITYTDVHDAGTHNHDITIAGSGGIINNSVTATNQSNTTGINSTNNSGGGLAHDNMPPYVIVNYIIKL